MQENITFRLAQTTDILLLNPLVNSAGDERFGIPKHTDLEFVVLKKPLVRDPITWA